MKDYYSILQSFFSKTNNQKRLNQLEKIKDNKTELIKLFNMVKPESLDYRINKIKNTMKLSEFKSYIQEEIVDVLREATIETSPEDLAKVKSTADDDDIIKVTENLNPEVIKAVDRFIKGIAKKYSYSEQDAIFAIEQALAKRQPSMTTDMPGFEGTMDALDSLSIREEEEDDMDKQASKAAKKGDSIATIASKYQKLASKMKELAKEYKAAEGDEKEKIKDQLKDMTKEKKQLEKAL